MHKLYVYLGGSWGIFTFHNQSDRATAITILTRHGIDWMVRD